MTTDHDLIARACRLVRIPEMQHGGILYEVCWGEDPNAYQALHRDNPALHALLVWKLAERTRAEIYHEEGEGAAVMLYRRGVSSRYFHLDKVGCIRVLVDALKNDNG